MIAGEIHKGKLERLEARRGAAAVYVLATHLVKARLGIGPGLLGLLFGFGQEVVIVFFLLSSFVIFYSISSSPGQSFGSYFQRRWLRIYPIFFVALFISWLLANSVGHKVDWLTLIGNLAMFQDFSSSKPGVWVDTFGGNLPLWSLSYPGLFIGDLLPTCVQKNDRVFIPTIRPATA